METTGLGSGTVYPMLKRLEEEGSLTRESVKRVGREIGRYTLTASGITVAREIVTTMKQRDDARARRELRDQRRIERATANNKLQSTGTES
jgi:DNA-binding PadR family transcriptional regulator